MVKQGINLLVFIVCFALLITAAYYFGISVGEKSAGDGYKEVVKRMQHSNDSLAILNKLLNDRIEKRNHSIIYRQTLDSLLEEAERARNTQKIEFLNKIKQYEKELVIVMHYSDNRMDSLFRARYPVPDSLHR